MVEFLFKNNENESNLIIFRSSSDERGSLANATSINAKFNNDINLSHEFITEKLGGVRAATKTSTSEARNIATYDSMTD